MIKEKQQLIGNLNVKQSLSSKLGNAIIYIDPITQEKSVEPSKLKQVIIPDDGFNGLSKVTVNKIADNYVIPTGEIEIKENGNYDVTDKVSVNVNVPEKVLDVKSITSNGTYKASDDNLDGYSQIDVNVTAEVNWDEYYTNPLMSPNLADAGFQYSFTSGINASLKKIPSNLTFSGSNISAQYMFRGCRSLTDCSALANIDTSMITNTNAMFQWCVNLTTIPLFDTSKVTDMSNMFTDCQNLTSVPLFDTSKVTNMYSTFAHCKTLSTIPQLDTSNVTNMSYLFQGCTNLQTIPLLNTTKATNFNGVFQGCTNLTSIPQLNASNATNLGQMFSGCSKLTNVPQLNAQKVINLSSMFSSCTNLTTFGGLENLGQGYTNTSSANVSSYTLTLSACTKLTEQSIINVLNNLYDIATKGCKAQKVVLGATNLAKLTSEEGQQALTNAQAKGWTIS